MKNEYRKIKSAWHMKKELLRLETFRLVATGHALEVLTGKIEQAKFRVLELEAAKESVFDRADRIVANRAAMDRAKQEGKR